MSLLAETLARDAELAGDAVPPKMRDRVRRSRSRPATSSRWSTSCSTSPGSRAAVPSILLDDVDLGRVAADSAERLRVFADRQGLRLVVDVAPHVPAIRGDEGRLGQVVVNLVHNALKFSRPDAVDEDDPVAASATATSRREVRVIVRASGDDVTLAVEDHGIGIPRADQDRIFERFYKVDRVRPRTGGTGLGLAIARHVIEQHGGRIRVESEEGRGSTFIVSLPVAERAETAVGAA